MKILSNHSLHTNYIHLKNKNNRNFEYVYNLYERSDYMAITLEEAKAMMSSEAIENLRKVVISHPNINTERKANCDILMQALCRAVVDEIILPESLDEKTVKLLNAKTNTLSPAKLGEIIEHVRKKQPKLACVIKILEPVDDMVVHKWVFIGPSVSFADIFKEVIKMFEITPASIRTKMTETLKPTIVNNIAQCVGKYLNTGDVPDISITTISRLVNMSNHLIYADFEEVD